MSKRLFHPWSYSFLSSVETCPRQAYGRYVEKIRESDTAATLWGTAVHEALENYVRDGVPLGEQFTQYQALAGSIRSRTGLTPSMRTFCEHEMGVDENWQPCDFHGPEVYGRGIADVLMVMGGFAWIGDWKTGKVKENSFQVSVFAALVFTHFPEVQRITANNIWLKTGQVGKSHVFERHDLADIKKEIEMRVDEVRMHEALGGPWPARPSGLCRGWCSVTNCAHWQPKRE